MPPADPPPLRLLYRNWRGEERERVLRPVNVWHGASPHHARS